MHYSRREEDWPIKPVNRVDRGYFKLYFNIQSLVLLLYNALVVWFVNRPTTVHASISSKPQTVFIVVIKRTVLLELRPYISTFLKGILAFLD